MKALRIVSTEHVCFIAFVLVCTFFQTIFVTFQTKRVLKEQCLVIELVEIIERCKKYDITAQQLLYERYVNTLYSVCLHYIPSQHDAKDILQDSFIKIFGNIKQYKGTGSFEGWMTRIVINTAIKHLNKTKKKQNSDICIFEDNVVENEEFTSLENGKIEDSYNSIEQANFSKEELLDVIHSIPEVYKIVFSMFHLEGLSHEEISKMLDIDVNNSRIRLLRARKFIREALVKCANNRTIK